MPDRISSSSSSSFYWDEEEPVDIPLSCADPLFQWKGVSTLMNGLSEEQIQRQLITLQRLVTSRDRPALQHLVKSSKEIDLTLPLRGVTPLSLAIYLRFVHRQQNNQKLSSIMAIV